MSVFKVAVAILLMVSFLKWCAACSLSYQPNDLQVCFMVIRRYFRSKEYKDDMKKNLPSPMWLGRFEKFLTDSKVDKASVKTFVACVPYLWRVMGKTYTTKNVIDGWLISAVRDPVALLNRCPAIQQLSEIDRAALGEKVLALAIQTFPVGLTTEEDMRAVGLHLYFDNSTIVNVTGKPLNQQRSMLLTSEAAQSMRAELYANTQAKKVEARKKQDAAGLQAAAKAAVASTKFVCIQGPPPPSVWGCSRGTCPLRDPADTWKGCPVPGCTVWACVHTDACSKEFKSHVSKHLAYAAGQKVGQK
jgi:hypothetical protein